MTSGLLSNVKRSLRLSIRRNFVRALERSGLLWKSPYRTFGRGERERFVVLMYHRISASQTPDFLPSPLTCPLSKFLEHLAVLKQHFSVLALDEVREILRSGRELPPRTVVLTFDDSWFDNLEFAARPLAEAGLPGTFFIPSADIDREDLHPDHRFYFLSRRVPADRFREVLQSMIPRSAASTPPPDHIFPLRRWLEASLGYVLVSPQGSNFLDALERELGAPPTDGMGRSIYMTSEQVRSLSDFGVRVGNHTAHHWQLSSLDEAGQQKELADAQEALAALVGEPITTLAYPYGEPQDYNETSVRVSRELGFCCACTAVPGYNDASTDPLLLHRINPTWDRGRELVYRLLWGSRPL